MLLIPFKKIAHNTSWFQVFRDLPEVSLREVSWPAFPYCPEVRFKIAHDGLCIYLEYQVREQQILARYRRVNEPVYKDSCVEFFLSFDQEHYYNMEFNALGTALVGYGKNKKGERQRLSSERIGQIEVRSSLAEDKAAYTIAASSWSLQLKIPKSLFYYHPQLVLEGSQGFANFYKCGDDLKEPHFVAWKKVNTLEPDFHQPASFGTVLFGQIPKC